MMTNSSSWAGDAGGRFGIFSSDDADNPKVVAVEFDNYANQDTDPQLFINTSQKPNVDNHFGLDDRSAISKCWTPRSYLLDLNFSLWQRNELFAWIDYNSNTSVLELRLAKNYSRPLAPIFNCTYNLYDAVDEKMWIGFSGAIGNFWNIYYVYNWTFTSFGISPDFSTSKSDQVEVGVIAGVCGSVLVGLLGTMIGVCVFVRRRRAQQETWDKEGLMDMSGMPEFISYKHLSAATRQFSDESKLGQGGFGTVYRGVLPKTGAHVAVKKVSRSTIKHVANTLRLVNMI